jgi:hypothetical protein
MRFPVVPASRMRMPLLLLPEITLPAPAAVPPNVLLVAPVASMMPLKVFPIATVPVMSVPM